MQMDMLYICRSFVPYEALVNGWLFFALEITRARSLCSLMNRFPTKNAEAGHYALRVFAFFSNVNSTWLCLVLGKLAL